VTPPQKAAAPDTDPGPRQLAYRFRAAWSLVWRSGPALAAVSAGHKLVLGLAPVAVAWLTKYLLDSLGAGSGPTGAVAALATGLAVAGLIVAAAPHVEQYLAGRVRRGVDLVVRDRVFAAVNRFTGLGRFEDPTFHDSVRLAQQAAPTAADQIASPTLVTVQSLVTVVGFVGSLLTLSPVMTALVVLAVVPAAVAQTVLSRQEARLNWRLSPVLRRQIVYADLMTDVDTAKEVRLFAFGGFLHRRLITELRSSHAAEHTLARRTVRVQGLLAVLGALIAGGGLVWTVLGIAAGRLTPGDMALFIAAVAAVQSALNGIVTQTAGVYAALLLFGHYLDVARSGPDLPVPEHPEPVHPLRHGIELRDVWFRYHDDQPWILRGLTLTIPAGATVAVVGLNGAGKSTIVKLLCRFYDPLRGSIRWDGTDIRAVDIGQLRRRMSAVFQDEVRYPFTAAENVAVGDIDALDDRPRLADAARLAGVHDALAALPRGYDTMLSRLFFLDEETAHGVVLSGGQWQRLGIARAFLRPDPDLVILDEPSAGLDPDAEHALDETLRRHRTGRTCVLISHRLSTVRTADLIAVVADGRVAEFGDHETLVAAGGEYARLFTLQARAFAPTGQVMRRTTTPSTRSAGA
jgi:ATP-binding cassette, subfamily B, bacterial